MKRTTIALAALSLLAASEVRAQSYWAEDVGGPGNDHVADVKTDSAGNIYATGEFSGSIVFGGNTYVSSGGIDMFMTKLSPTGQVLWFVQGGGPGIDRGIKLCVRGGHVAVVGEFMQTATFQGQALTSAGGPDIFLAMHDAATGTLQWIVHGGGPLASDRPYGVTIAGSGRVTMVGEFSGTVDIGGETLTSMLDPDVQLPSVDVFISTYSPQGVAQWTRQGSAEHTDRAIDVVNDAADNIYVTGQFSDTIQFVDTYPNVMYNATFLLKLDAAGNEVWFRRAGGAVYDEVRDMQWSSTNDLLVVGDLEGTMIFLDSVPDLISSGAPYAYYLLRVGGNGQLLADTVVTSANPLSGRALDERNGIVTVLGQFECQFTSLVDSAHAGLWSATGTQDLFVARHALDSLGFKDAQQFGGDQEKLAGQVTTLNDGSPIFCGSYEHVLVFPCADVFSADIASALPPYGLYAPNGAGYCGDPNYGSFAADTSDGLKDGFIARGYVLGRSPYDWWDRSDAPCSFLPRSLCLGGGITPLACEDTVAYCGPGFIGIHPDFAYSIDRRSFFVGPDLDFLWSTGATTDSLHVTTSGTYGVTCTTTNGCLQWTDSIEVLIHPFPPQPLLSDNVIVATNTPESYEINICDPTQVWLWCSNVDTTTTYYWTGPNGTVMNDSLLVDTSTVCYFHMVNAFGCSTENHVLVIDNPNAEIPDVDVDLAIEFPQDTDHNDTLDICPQQYVSFHVDPTWTLNNAPYTFPYTYPASYYFGFDVNGFIDYVDDPYYAGDLLAPSSHWYVITTSVRVVNSPCGTDTLLLPATVTDSIYVHVFPATAVEVSITGPDVICPADEALLVASCPACDELIWMGNGIINTSGDSAYVHNGYFTAYGAVSDTNGCSFSDEAVHYVSYPGVPELDVYPPDGIICPDSVAVIYTHAQGTYTWYGPPGEMPIDNDSILVTIPGEYYLSLVDPNGCSLTSDPILVTGYATPYLNVLPDGVLCLGEAPVLLQVVTTGYSSLAWSAPLTGSSLTQQVGQPGTYSCTVQACGITTELSTQIVVGSAMAEVLDPGPFRLCAGDTVELQAAAGQAAYFWDPGPVFGDHLIVTHGGAYTLTVLDANGCADTASAVVVLGDDPNALLTIADRTVCSGTPVTLQETAGGDLAWYADSALVVLLGTGPMLDLGTPTDSTTLYLVRTDSLCTGQPVRVEVAVVEPPAALVSGPDSLCVGVDATLIAQIDAPFQAVWSTPAGTASGDTLAVGQATLADAGWYVVQAVSGECRGTADSLLLTVLPPTPLDLGPDTAICPGAAVLFLVPPGFTDPLWQGSIAAPSFTTDEPGPVQLTAVDVHGCAALDTVLLSVLVPSVPVTANDLTLCRGQDAVLVATGSGTLTWYADAGLQDTLGTGNALTLPMPMDSLVLYLVQAQFGCTGQSLPVAVNVVPIPVDVTLSAPAHFCVGAPGTVSASGPPGLEGTWTTPAGTYVGTSVSFPSAQPDEAGWYVLVPSVAGCLGTADSVLVSVLAPLPLTLGADTSFCNGGAFHLALPAGFTDPQWSTGATDNSIDAEAAGTYSLQATDANGCVTQASIHLIVVDCPPIVPNVITPNGDGVNDGFSLGAVGAVSGELSVYDRWGVLVHVGDPIGRSWDATYDKNRELVPDGVYYYVLRLVDSAGGSKQFTGYFNVLR